MQINDSNSTPETLPVQNMFVVNAGLTSFYCVAIVPVVRQVCVVVQGFSIALGARHVCVMSSCTVQWSPEDKTDQFHGMLLQSSNNLLMEKKMNRLVTAYLRHGDARYCFEFTKKKARLFFKS